jgi:hypothetical protein
MYEARRRSHGGVVLWPATRRADPRLCLARPPRVDPTMHRAIPHSSCMHDWHSVYSCQTAHRNAPGTTPSVSQPSSTATTVLSQTSCAARRCVGGGWRRAGPAAVLQTPGAAPARLLLRCGRRLAPAVAAAAAPKAAPADLWSESCVPSQLLSGLEVVRAVFRSRVVARTAGGRASTRVGCSFPSCRLRWQRGAGDTAGQLQSVPQAQLRAPQRADVRDRRV